MERLLGQVLRLTKSILLRPEDKQARLSTQFMAGKDKGSGFSGTMGLEWWFSDDYRDALNSVVMLLTKSSPEFLNCDQNSVSQVINETLQELCIDETVFNVDTIFFSPSQTLFDCRLGEVTKFAESILAAMKRKLSDIIGLRCTLYAIPRVKTLSFAVADETLHVIAKDDQVAWQGLIDKGYEFGHWSPASPKLVGQNDRAFTPSRAFDCVLVAEETGTQEGTKFSSTLRFRKLISVMLAVASQSARYPFTKSMARPSEFCIQFPFRSAPKGSIVRSDCGSLIPYFISDVSLGINEIEGVQRWYKEYSKCEQQTRQRIDKGAHFLNRAINSDDIESYVNYFVALDALFGKRGAVESSILEGISGLGVDSKFSEKASWLFDLRNELVHGGSRYVAEWPDYLRYTQHFRTEPLADVRSLAQLAVLNAPRVLGEK